MGAVRVNYGVGGIGMTEEQIEELSGPNWAIAGLSALFESNQKALKAAVVAIERGKEKVRTLEATIAELRRDA